MPDFVLRIPEGDDRERKICADCGHIAYENPKIVVGAVVAVGDAILMCRRAIEPRRGVWTLPAGYMELHETLEEGAAREAWVMFLTAALKMSLPTICTLSRLASSSCTAKRIG